MNSDIKILFTEVHFQKYQNITTLTFIKTTFVY